MLQVYALWPSGCEHADLVIDKRHLGMRGSYPHAAVAANAMPMPCGPRLHGCLRGRRQGHAPQVCESRCSCVTRLSTLGAGGRLQVPVVAGIPNAALVTFQGCGHLALFQAVDAFVSLVNAFTSAQGIFVPHTDSFYICEGTS